MKVEGIDEKNALAILSQLFGWTWAAGAEQLYRFSLTVSSLWGSVVRTG